VGGGFVRTQSVYELSDGSGMVLTVGRYLTPARIDIDRQGIAPDFSTLPTFEAAQERVKCVPRRPQPTKNSHSHAVVVRFRLVVCGPLCCNAWRLIAGRRGAQDDVRAAQWSARHRVSVS
jgi:hypothetical protein